MEDMEGFFASEVLPRIDLGEEYGRVAVGPYVVEYEWWGLPCVWESAHRGRISNIDPEDPDGGYEGLSDDEKTEAFEQELQRRWRSMGVDRRGLAGYGWRFMEPPPNVERMGFEALGWVVWRRRAV